MQVTVESGLHALLVRHARNALPGEACGLLAASPEVSKELRIRQFVLMTNLARGLDGFAMDPIEIARAEARFRALGLRLAATFHSHPDAPAVPSEADRADAWPELVHLILSIGADGKAGRLTAWQYCGASLRELPMRSLPKPLPRTGTNS